MNPLARLEHTCARFVEGTFARIFPSALEPDHVGRKLVAALRATPTDTYLVRVHPADYGRFAEDRDFLEARWSAMLREAAAPGERPRAVLHEDPSVIAGVAAIEAVTDERPPDLAFLRADGARVALAGGLTIGRAATNGLVVADSRASRTHAAIVAEGTGYVIEDRGSSNGTFVDGKPVLRARLKPGSVVTIGDTVLTVGD